ncbi:MAG: S1-like domain-containing RNA-binding protein [Tissierellia bacterium]|nr:S1-like domain-containing RNA-binding protein [Tissierellia bacterium]
MELGKIQKLKVVEKVRDGWILSDGQEEILLEGAKAQGQPKKGEDLEVFIYKNNQNDLVATMEPVQVQVGQVAKLQVVDRTPIGYFVNIGLDKDILLPFSEVSEKIQLGQAYLLLMYVDKAQRLAMTMKIKDHLSTKSPYKMNDRVEGTIYHIAKHLGALVAVDNRYDGMIPIRELKGIYKAGDKVEARVARVLRGGQLTLTLRSYAHIQMAQDADVVWDLLEEYGGVLPLGDKSDPEEILDLTGLSKSAFKRAVGRLYKERRVVPGAKEIKKK